MQEILGFEDTTKEELISAIEASQTGVWRWDVATNRIVWSGQLQKLFGLKPGEFKNSYDHYMSLIHPDDRDKVSKIVQTAIENKNPYEVEHRVVWPDGSVHWLLGRGQAFFDVAGNLSKMTGVTVSIDTRKKQEIELARKTIELERFAAIAAHDLRAPLNSITQFTELLASQYRGKLDFDADEYIGFIIRAGNRMREFIDSLLTYAKAGEFSKRDINRVGVSEILLNVRSNLLAEITKTDARIIVNGKLPEVEGNEIQLIQLFQNLISNAIKYKRANVAPVVEISVEEHDQFWKIIIKDNGIGIEEKHQPFIFDFLRRFQNENDSDGNGIGLAVCKKIVESHGGLIEVSSVPGTGSIFSFTLPVSLALKK